VALAMHSADNNASSGDEIIASGDEQMDTTTKTSPLISSPEPPPPPKEQQDHEPRNAEDVARAESPTKRAKPQPAIKIMPRNYMEGDVRDLGIIISHMLMELIRINDRLPFDPERLTRFHSRYVHFIYQTRHSIQEDHSP
jgi:hypothetical protein